ncbi:hypothetical protein [Glycomyces buryatensis]|uniref:Uncharacterized protein n=1 Tax=Glycomyces buryatensis TaxID=2570927 RepID=A0A4S8QA04_9ACTN|nr:hypothetical protein [Glycomyces buryatensis]THV41168.1 hypothetical protein FAB82_13030 [Glycomyces buryatensis]
MNEVLEELHAQRQFGPKALELLLKLAESELHRFPELQRDKSKDHVDFALEFFGKSGKALVTDVLARAEDDNAVGRMMRRYLRNRMIDKARQGPRGRLRETLRKRLERDPRFKRVPGTSFWQLADGPSTASKTDPNSLIQVARECRVSPVGRHGSGTSQPRLGKTGEIEALLIAVFEAAKGSLDDEKVTTVVAARLPLQVRPEHLPLGPGDDFPSAAPTPEEQVIADEEAARNTLEAHRVYASLTGIERRLVPAITDPAEASKILGKKRSSTAVKIKQLKAKLVELAGDAAAARGTLGPLLELCREASSSSASSLDGPVAVPSDPVERQAR